MIGRQTLRGLRGGNALVREIRQTGGGEERKDADGCLGTRAAEQCLRLKLELSFSRTDNSSTVIIVTLTVHIDGILVPNNRNDPLGVPPGREGRSARVWDNDAQHRQLYYWSESSMILRKVVQPHSSSHMHSSIHPLCIYLTYPS
jgi:hypothetical protein